MVHQPHPGRLGERARSGRREGRNLECASYIGRQTQGSLPAGWNAQRRNVVIFNSSEDEFVGMGKEWCNPIYAMQADGVRRITADAVARHPGVMFYLRMHPNLIGVDNRDTRLCHELASAATPNLVVVPPDSDIATYALLEAADSVITFGSTVGVEATYWGKPSLLAGHAFYEDLDAAYVARTHEHLLDLIGEAAEPKPRVNALKYGHYQMTFGEDFRYWVAEDFSHGSFRGKSIKCEPKSWLVARLMMAFR